MAVIKPEWKKRGFANEHEIKQLIHLSDYEIIRLLESDEAGERTCAATILGERKSKISIISLCNALKKEKALYTKIAISEALGKIGNDATIDLILLLGKIGQNQYKKLPESLFEKWNYPLPRDIAARTIIKIGETAILPILKEINEMKKESLSEAIDAIGFISFYCDNKSALQHLLALINFHKPDNLIVWKIIRSLQSFPSNEVEMILENYLLHDNNPAIRWEAARSLGQICQFVPESILLASCDKNELVRKMSLLSKVRIEKKNPINFKGFNSTENNKKR